MNRSNNAMGMQNGHILTNYKQKVAYHEAGHATAIHCNNRLKKLPPVFFQIIFKAVVDEPVNCSLTGHIGQLGCVSRVNGGLIVQSLPLSFDCPGHQAPTDADKNTFQYTDEYRLAFEADIVNLLIGPLAEAKYNAQIDNEPFNEHLVTVAALKNYGGKTDLAIVDDYLHSYSIDKCQQHESLGRLFILDSAVETGLYS